MNSLRTLLMVSCFWAGTCATFAQPGTLDTGFDTDGVALYQEVLYITPANSLLVLSDSTILTIGERYDGSGSQLLMVNFLPDGSLNAAFGNQGNGIGPTYGGPGVVKTDLFDSNREFADAALVQPDGKIVVGGSVNTGYNWMIARYRSTGYLDSTFGQNGYLTQDWGGFDEIFDLHLLPDGRILASGNANGKVGVARFSETGVLDTGFGVSGLASLSTTSTYSGRIVVDSLGRIYLCGATGSNVVVGRFLAGGTIDTGFGQNGTATIGASGNPSQVNIDLLSDEKIMVVADQPDNQGQNSSMVLIRLLTNGTVDNTFDGDGKKTVSLGNYVTPHALIIQRDDRVLVAGRLVMSGAADLFVAKFLPDGTLDPAFGTGGYARSGLGTDLGSNSGAGYSMALQPDGKILVGGSLSLSGLTNQVLVRFNNTVGFPTSIDRDAVLQPLKLSPNPAHEQVEVVFPAGKWERLRVYALSGQRVTDVAVTPQQAEEILNVKNWPSGLYTISIEGNGQVRSAKFWKE